MANAEAVRLEKACHTWRHRTKSPEVEKRLMTEKGGGLQMRAVTEGVGARPLSDAGHRGVPNGGPSTAGAGRGLWGLHRTLGKDGSEQDPRSGEEIAAAPETRLRGLPAAGCRSA